MAGMRADAERIGSHAPLEEGRRVEKKMLERNILWRGNASKGLASLQVARGLRAWAACVGMPQAGGDAKRETKSRRRARPTRSAVVAEHVKGVKVGQEGRTLGPGRRQAQVRACLKAFLTDCLSAPRLKWPCFRAIFQLGCSFREPTSENSLRYGERGLRRVGVR